MTGNGNTRHPLAHQQQQAAPAGPDPMVAIDVRNRAVDRMRWMNHKHAQHAWDQRYRDPLAPYGLAFLFVQPDPRRPDRLAVKAATKLTDAAYYVGVGLSSLDTHTGAWEQAREHVDGLADVPGQVMIVLTDQTTIVCDRRGLAEFNAFHIHSTHSLGDTFTHGGHQWSWSQPDELHSDPAHAEVLRWLDTLNLTLWQADNTRIVAARAAGRVQRRGEHGR
jgi:hypothetical protein